jgi:hypothetical protein
LAGFGTGKSEQGEGEERGKGYLSINQSLERTELETLNFTLPKMLRKKEAYTVITPIPSFIPRQLAIDILHSHSEVITLNPLVLEHKPIPAPRNAASDEYYSTWYEITERIQLVPGVGRLGASRISFNGCFHDMPWGLQTHIYAPMNIDLRNRYRIGGNQPGEPPETKEIGLETPADGLYLREDIEIRCNLTMVSFVKAQSKAASKEMVSRIIKKAELLDAGVLQAMMLDGKLKTINPNDRTMTGLQSPALTSTTASSPRLSYQQQQHLSFPPPPSQRPGTAGSQYSTNPRLSYQTSPHQQQQQFQYQQHPQAAELPFKEPVPSQSFVTELPGDYQHPLPSPGLPQQQQQQHYSQHQQQPQHPHQQQQQHPQHHQQAHYQGEQRWSQPQPSPKLPYEYRNSVSSTASSGGHLSPGFPSQQFNQGYSAELPAHPETAEEHGRR